MPQFERRVKEPMKVIVRINIPIDSPYRSFDLFSINANEEHKMFDRKKVFYPLKERDGKTRTTPIKFINDNEQRAVGTVENSVGDFGKTFFELLAARLQIGIFVKSVACG